VSASGWEQLTIVHISDLHFGENHSFSPPSGGASVGIPRLGESILAGLSKGQFAIPGEFGPGVGAHRPRVVLAITGDFNQKCLEPEFEAARKFLEEFYDNSIFDTRITADDIFIVPGNHDLRYAEGAAEDRWSKYCLFYYHHNNRRGRPEGAAAPFFDPTRPETLSRIIDQSDKGLIVAEINSSAYVQKGTDDERRGQIDQGAIDRIDTELNTIDQNKKHAAIKIALVHHHPVVLPVLAEADKGYDAILNSELLLDVLKRHAFHLVLHGHKHNPYTFSYDAVCAWMKDRVQPLLIVAGGSAGSEGLPPNDPGATNTYNVISVKWHSGASQARVHVETRGLVRRNESGNRLPAPQWHWKTLRIDDRLLAASRRRTEPSAPDLTMPVPPTSGTDLRRPHASSAPDLTMPVPPTSGTDLHRPSASSASVRGWEESDQAYADLRSQTLVATRRNFPAIEVLPSLNPTQGYEARVWIEGQPHNDYKPPTKVEWSASPHWFKQILVCDRASDPEFHARFAYYGPTLLQARMFWEDGYEAQAYIYARIPRSDRL
jgi:3',5'-cyclic AMP phosphodiesterase CpdA